jgi:hypothetical protein
MRSHINQDDAIRPVVMAPAAFSVRGAILVPQ